MRRVALALAALAAPAALLALAAGRLDPPPGWQVRDVERYFAPVRPGQRIAYVVREPGRAPARLEIDVRGPNGFTPITLHVRYRSAQGAWPRERSPVGWLSLLGADGAVNSNPHELLHLLTLGDYPGAADYWVGRESLAVPAGRFAGAAVMETSAGWHDRILYWLVPDRPPLRVRHERPGRGVTTLELAAG